MTTAYFTHDTFFRHDTGSGHPERADRLRTIDTALDGNAFKDLVRPDVPQATAEQITSVHPRSYYDCLQESMPPSGGPVALDVSGDVIASPGTWPACQHAAGAAIAAVDGVLAGRFANAFCAVRPPGHHAETNTAMGFCLFNNVVIAAVHALNTHGLERVAIVDFDVHHGNGTQDLVWARDDIFFGSIHESPLYPGTGRREDTGAHNTIVNAPVPNYAGGDDFHDALEGLIMPALDAFKPEFILISAGFDAHRRDPLATCQLEANDYARMTQTLADAAHRHCNGRLVSCLEGGYDLTALEDSVPAHVECLLHAGARTRAQVL